MCGIFEGRSRRSLGDRSLWLDVDLGGNQIARTRIPRESGVRVPSPGNPNLGTSARKMSIRDTAK